MQTTEELKQPHEWLTHWAIKTPNAPIFRDGLQEITFAEALELSQKLATKLQDLNIPKQSIVSLDLPTGLQIVFMCALLSQGITSQIHAPNRKSDFLFSTQQDIKVDAPFLRVLQSLPATNETRAFETEDIVRLVYSSGTTGSPKPIPLTLDMVHHRSIAAHELAFEKEPFLSMLDLSTASGFHTFYGCLMNGTCYYNPGDGQHNANLINRYQITSVKASPAQLSELVKAAEKDNQKLPSLKTIYSAGSAMPQNLLEKLRTLTNARVFTLYGSSEAGRCAQRELTDNDSSNVGQIVEGTQLRIVNQENDPTKPGLVQYKRSHQATQYLNDQAVTDQVFQDGWFNTGDIGYLNENHELIIQGRTSDVVNAGGIKVNLAELDQFAQSLPLVTDAAAFVTEDETGTPTIALAIETKADPREIVQTLKSHFGSLAPTVIFKLPSLPRNNAGKISRSELQDLYNKAQGK